MEAFFIFINDYTIDYTKARTNIPFVYNNQNTLPKRKPGTNPGLHHNKK